MKQTFIITHNREKPIGIRLIRNSLKAFVGDPEVEIEVRERKRKQAIDCTTKLKKLKEYVW